VNYSRRDLGLLLPALAAASGQAQFEGPSIQGLQSMRTWRCAAPRAPF